MKHVWVFNANRSNFPNAVFTTKSKAELWVRVSKASGVLTKYPLDISVSKWALDKGFIEPKTSSSTENELNNCTAFLEHIHYSEGE